MGARLRRARDDKANEDAPPGPPSLRRARAGQESALPTTKRSERDVPPHEFSAVKTIRVLAQQFGLSRTTLLYYDRLGLLRPDYRTSAGHRLYSPADEARLARICQLRAAGLPLRQIDAVLEPERGLRTPLNEALDRRLTELNREIAGLRRQQQVVVTLLRRAGAARRTRIMTKESWVALLEAAGMDEADRRLWHREFERLSPEAHQDFLESLGLPEPEIRFIRRWSEGRSPGHSAADLEPTPATASAVPAGPGDDGTHQTSRRTHRPRRAALL